MKQAFFCVLLFILSLPLSAKHLIGGTISYENVGQVGNNTSYAIKVKLFRDCSTGSTNFDTNITVCVYKQGILYMAIDMPMTTSVPISTLPYMLCIEEANYDKTISLPVSATGYTLLYLRCCRSNIIVNLATPDIVGFRLSTTIPPNSIVNSSPELSHLYPFFGSNLQFQHNIVTTEIDNDSFAHELTIPLIGATADDPVPTCLTQYPLPNTVALNPNFSLQNLMNSNTPLTISPSGQLNAGGSSGGEYAFGIDTREYRNGELLSSTHSEFSLHILYGYVGIEKAFSQLDFTLSPNPANSNLQVSLSELKNYEIFSMQGLRLTSGTQTSINISDLAAGIYILKVENAQGIGRKFFIKE